MRDHFSEGSRWLAAFLALDHEVADADSRVTARMDALFVVGRLALFHGEYNEARALLEEMVVTARDANSPHHTASALIVLGHIALEQRDYTTAQALYREGIPFARETNDRFGDAVLTGSLGIALAMHGDAAAARQYLDASSFLLRQLGDTSQISRMFRWQGVVAILEGDTEAARAHLVEGLRLHHTLHSLLGVAESLEIFAALYVTLAQPTRALRLLGAATHIRATVTAPLPLYLQEWLTHQIEPARRTLGAAASDAAIAAGEAMPLEEAIAEALTTAPSRMSTATARRVSKARDDGLTKRERAVVAQIAVGKSNRQIAASLFVTEKTVE